MDHSSIRRRVETLQIPDGRCDVWTTLDWAACDARLVFTLPHFAVHHSIPLHSGAHCFSVLRPLFLLGLLGCWTVGLVARQSSPTICILVASPILESFQLQLVGEATVSAAALVLLTFLLTSLGSRFGPRTRRDMNRVYSTCEHSKKHFKKIDFYK